METGTEPERLTRGYAGRIFLWVTFGWALAGFGRKLLPPLLPVIISDLGITPFEAGIALTTLWLVRASNQYPGGRLADELSRKTVLVSSILIIAAGFTLLSIAFWYGVFVLALGVIGFGDGAFSVSMRTTVADLYVDKRGKAFGIQGAFTGAAGVAAAGGAILILAVASWRHAFFPLAIVLVGITIGVHSWHQGEYIIKKPSIGIVATLSRLARNVAVRRVIFAFVFFSFAWQGMMGFLPAFLQAEKGLTTTGASIGFGLVYLVGIAAAPLAGAIGDNTGKLRTVIGVLLCAITGLAFLLTAESIMTIGASIIILAIGFRSFFDLTQALLMDAFSDHTMAGDLGAAKTIWSGLGSIGPAYVGWVVGWADYRWAFVGLIGCVCGSLVLLVLVDRLNT